MTPAAQNIAIAESLGYFPGSHCFEQQIGEYEYEHRGDCPCGGTGWNIPDYFNDLNACHEFEQTLTDEEYVKFSSGLDDIVTRDAFAAGTKPPFGLPATMLRHYSATAPQRCESYLRTKGLWDDSK